MPTFQVVPRYVDDGDMDRSEMFLFFSGLTDTAATLPMLDAPRAFAIRPVLMRPRASGRVTIASVDARQQPTITLNCVSDPEDLRRLMAGLRRARDIAQRRELAPFVSRIAGIDAATIASDSALAAYVRASVDSFCHATGTARMGSAGDAEAVVDERCRVRGVGNPWIVDASVIPAPPSVPPHLTTIMIGERVADWLRRGCREPEHRRPPG